MLCIYVTKCTTFSAEDSFESVNDPSHVRMMALPFETGGSSRHLHNKVNLQKRSIERSPTALNLEQWAWCTSASLHPPPFSLCLSFSPLFPRTSTQTRGWYGLSQFRLRRVQNSLQLRVCRGASPSPARWHVGRFAFLSSSHKEAKQLGTRGSVGRIAD